MVDEKPKKQRRTVGYYIIEGLKLVAEFFLIYKGKK